MTARRTRTALGATLLGVVVLLAGCGGSGSSATATDGASVSLSGSPSMSMSMSAGSSMSMSAKPAGSATITIHDFAFDGGSSVAAGSTVTVTNQDSETHSVTSDDASGFDVTVPAGGSRTFTAPSAAGTYPYHCLFHSDMHGTLRVR